jgi:electron transfer flavoprotein beta subunit
MRIVVLFKEVPDSFGDRELDLQTGLAVRAADEAVPDEISERALEVALTHAQAHPGVEVVVLGMGPAGAEATLRKGLALGADEAVHVVDDALAGADLTLTAETLAAALRHIGFDLVVAGDASSDGSGGVVPAMLAELLDVPQLTALSSVEISDGQVAGLRSADGTEVALSASLPSVISITEAFPEGRLATFKGIAAAKKKTVTKLSAADLGVDVADDSVPRSIMVSIAAQPARTAGVTISDQGDAGTLLAEYLMANGLV